MAQWVDEELSTLDLGDTRRNQRVKHMVAKMADRPGGSVPQVFETRAEAVAAYRALSSDAVEAEAIVSAARDACVKRMLGHRLVLAIQDTTSFSFAKHPATEGTGPLSDPHWLGFFLHDVLAVSADGIPLGLVHHKVWARDPDKPGTRAKRKQRPFAEKESFRWVESLRAVHEQMPPEVTVVTVADREADIFEVFAAPRPEGSELLIRAAYNRRLLDDERQLWDAVAAEPVAGELTVALRRHPQRRPREARLQVQHRTVVLSPPHYRVEGTVFEPVTVQAILVTELSAPEGETPIRWQLLTTLPVDGFDAARECVRYYSLRWLIERYHFVLKSGCRIEQSQLRTAERLERLLALYFVVAWRLLWLTYAARADGAQPCTVGFTDLEWKVAYQVTHSGKALPDKPPNLNQIVRMVASLGGFLGRKGDGEPGVKVLWRGLMRLQDIVLGVQLASDPINVCNA